MNRGLLAGLTSRTWSRYEWDMVVTNDDPAGAGLTQPTFDTYNGRYQFGRYMDLNGLIVVQAQVSYVGSTTVGSGGPYAFKLPVPARRSTPDTAVWEPIGAAMCYFSITGPYVNVPVTPILARPYKSLQGRHDSYCQFIAGRVVSWGSVDINAIAPSGRETISHRVGMTPQASDIQLVPMSYTGTQNVNPYWVDTIGSSTFEVHTYNNNGSGGGVLDLGWKIDAEPAAGVGGNLVGPYVPFDWSRFTSLSPFGNFFIELVYEPA